MTPVEASTIQKFLLTCFRSEFEVTAKVLAAVPEDRADYRPDDKNMTALELVQHIAFADIWFVESVIAGSFAAPDDSAVTAIKSPAEVVALYRDRIPALLEAADKLSGEHLASMVKFYTWEQPAVLYLQFCMVHTIHHRGQLSAYLRPMGAKVPSIYGGSADEPMTAASNA